MYIHLLSRHKNGSWVFLAGGLPAMAGVWGGGGATICAIGVTSYTYLILLYHRLIDCCCMISMISIKRWIILGSVGGKVSKNPIGLLWMRSQLTADKSMREIFGNVHQNTVKNLPTKKKVLLKINVHEREIFLTWNASFTPCAY